MNKVYLLTGGNVGNRQEYLTRAAGQIAVETGKIVKRSALYETAAWGKTDQAAFLNQVLELHTNLEAEPLMKHLLSIEENMGRMRLVKYGPRTIDIDILLFNHEVIQTNFLTVPHPQLANRMFALKPLNEIASGYMHPVLNKTIQQLMEACTDTLPVKKFSQL
jgi:2-amino-4-hydroxy-6-hydroxymethyldihydropteridine diphosphokinase